jgi:hypothetical protein
VGAHTKYGLFCFLELTLFQEFPLAERAIDEYLEATPFKARKSGLRLLQADVLVPYNAVVGVQRSFAETVNAYLEKKLTEE